MTPARSVAARYVDVANALDIDGLLSLFATDAVLIHTLGTFEGLDAIRAFYAGVVLPSAPRIAATGFRDDGADCLVDLEATSDAAPGRTFRLVDRFTVDADGRIVRLEIRMR